MHNLPFSLKGLEQIASFRRKYEAKNVLFASEYINVVILKLFIDRLLINRNRNDRVSELPRNKRRHAVSKARPRDGSQMAPELCLKTLRKFAGPTKMGIIWCEEWEKLFIKQQSNKITLQSLSSPYKHDCRPAPPRRNGGSFQRIQTG